MMDENNSLRQSGTIAVGEDLYGISIEELKERLSVFETEIIRVKAELEKKIRERSAAEDIFGSKS